MTSAGTISARRLLVTTTTMTLLAASGLCLPAIANADPPKFDEQGYTTCTAITVPAPDQDFDGMVTSCCAQNAGIPTSTKYGMACVAPPPAVVPADYRPTIVLPSRQKQTDDAGLLEGELDDLGNPPLPEGPNIVGDPFDDGGPN
jgi:hypothetical protein